MAKILSKRRNTAKRIKIAGDVLPSDALKKIARGEAKENGHSLGWWEEKENGCWTARCTTCFRIVSVIPRMIVRDKLGRGGKALSEYCVGEA